MTVQYELYVINWESVFRREGHGFITVPDLTHVLQVEWAKARCAQGLRLYMQTLGEKLSSAETQELIQEADLDGDGNVNYEEFVTMLFKVQYFVFLPHVKC